MTDILNNNNKSSNNLNNTINNSRKNTDYNTNNSTNQHNFRSLKAHSTINNTNSNNNNNNNNNNNQPIKLINNSKQSSQMNLRETRPINKESNNNTTNTKEPAFRRPSFRKLSEKSINNNNNVNKSNIDTNTKDLLCLNCFNKDYKTRSNNYNSLVDNSKYNFINNNNNNDPFKFHQSMSNQRNQDIQNKVKSRYNLSNQLGRNLIGGSISEKEKLIRKNEQGECDLSKLDTSVNHTLKRSTEKRLQKEDYVKGFIHNYNFNQKPNVDQYYSSYVNNKQNAFKANYRPHSVTSNKREYYDSLQTQIDYKNRLKSSQKQKDITIQNENLQKSKLEEENERRNNLEKMNKNRSSFIKGNDFLLSSKSRLEKYEKDQKKTEYNQYLNEVNNRLYEERLTKENLEKQKKNYISSSLNQQIEERKRKENLQRDHDRSFVNKAFVDTDMCRHKQCLYSCSLCNKQYPISYFNKRSKSYATLNTKKKI